MKLDEELDEQFSPEWQTPKIPDLIPSRFVETNITEALDHMKFYEIH
jgi:hypothetical protein